MASKKHLTVAYRRKREKRTDYHKRLQLLLSRKPRLVVRLSNRRIIAQIVEYQPHGDIVLAGMDSESCLKTRGWDSSYKNTPAAYALGLLLGKKAVAKGCPEAVLDTGFRAGLKGGKLFALLKGALDAGLKVPYGEGIFPPEERLWGKHLKNGGHKVLPVIMKIKNEIMEKK